MIDPRDRQDIAPEAHNSEQEDEDSQAQTLAEDALRRPGDFILSDSEKVGGGGELGSGTPDLVDHMNQMTSSGRIDMGAYRGERNDDDEDGFYGEEAMEDDFPHGAE